MRLSMWMIANRLSSLDLELNIREDARPILKSARMAYATNCVRVYASGNDVICDGEGDTVRMKDTTITEAFELVQCVFDFYDDWFADVLDLMKEKNYKEFVNRCWQVFHNPLILFDGNCRVLGLSEQYTADEMDEEWKYLSSYGYSSVNAISYIKYHNQEQDFNRTGIQRFSFKGDMCFPGVTCSLYFNETLCGRLNLLEKERPINPGDTQLLDILSDFLKIHLAEQDSSSSFGINANLFYRILDGQPVDEAQLRVQMSYLKWEPEDTYQLFLLELNQKEENRLLIKIMTHTILQQLPFCNILQRYPYIIVVCNSTTGNGISPEDTLRALTNGCNVTISCSLLRSGIYHLHALLSQTLSAITYGRLYRPEERFYLFHDYAMDYIIEASSLEVSVQACHPAVLELWKQKKELQDDRFETLKCYLNNERSLVAAASALFIHRNTMVYRVKKLVEFLTDDLDDVYTRDYMKLSIRTLELYEKKQQKPFVTPE